MTPAPLAYSSGPATIAVSEASRAAQARRVPKAERQAVRHYVNAHRKPNEFDKFWTNFKKTLGIK